MPVESQGGLLRAPEQELINLAYPLSVKKSQVYGLFQGNFCFANLTKILGFGPSPLPPLLPLIEI